MSEIRNYQKTLLRIILLALNGTWIALPATVLGDEHLIVTYDVSGSMNSRYLGDGMQSIIREVVHDIVFPPENNELHSRCSFYTRTEPGYNCGVESAPEFQGFPFIRPDANFSSFTFGDNVANVAARQLLNENSLRRSFPTTFTDNNTDIQGAIETVVTQLYDVDRDHLAYWIFVSDGKDDPANAPSYPVLAPIYLNYDTTLLYSIEVQAPDQITRPFRILWDENDPALRSAFPKGPPDRVVVQLYEVSDRSSSKPNELSYVNLSNDPDAKIQVLWSIDDSTWADTFILEVFNAVTSSGQAVSEIPSSEQLSYSFKLTETQLENSNQSPVRLRVVASKSTGGGRTSDTLIVPVERFDENVDIISSAGNIRIVWDIPGPPGTTVRLETSPDGLNWALVEGGESVPLEDGEYDIKGIGPNTWVRLTRNDEGSEEVILQIPDSVPDVVLIPQENTSDGVENDGSSVGPETLAGPGDGVVSFLILLAIALAISSFVYFILRKKPVSFTLRIAGRMDNNGNELQETFELSKGESLLFSESENTNFDGEIGDRWMDMDAPDDRLVYSRGVIYHERILDSGDPGGEHDQSGDDANADDQSLEYEYYDEAENTFELLSGEQFEVVSSQGVPITITFYLENARQKEDAPSDENDGAYSY